jgi:hypothetical protein
VHDCSLRRGRETETAMALLDDIVNGGNLATGLVVGVGALVLGR